MPKSPTQRTLDYSRARGNHIDIVERKTPRAGIPGMVSKDLFGFADLIELDTARGVIVAIQATSAPNHAARRKKVLANEDAPVWLRCGGIIEIWSWKQRPQHNGKAGKKMVWMPRVEGITLEMFK